MELYNKLFPKNQSFEEVKGIYLKSMGLVTKTIQGDYIFNHKRLRVGQTAVFYDGGENKYVKISELVYCVKLGSENYLMVFNVLDSMLKLISLGKGMVIFEAVGKGIPVKVQPKPPQKVRLNVKCPRLDNDDEEERVVIEIGSNQKIVDVKGLIWNAKYQDEDYGIELKFGGSLLLNKKHTIEDVYENVVGKKLIEYIELTMEVVIVQKIPEAITISLTCKKEPKKIVKMDLHVRTDAVLWKVKNLIWERLGSGEVETELICRGMEVAMNNKTMWEVFQTFGENYLRMNEVPRLNMEVKIIEKTKDVRLWMNRNKMDQLDVVISVDERITALKNRIWRKNYSRHVENEVSIELSYAGVVLGNNDIIAEIFRGRLGNVNTFDLVMKVSIGKEEDVFPEPNLNY